jgi:autotransporter passenger strand-loop-strand repeat protein
LEPTTQESGGVLSSGADVTIGPFVIIHGMTVSASATLELTSGASAVNLVDGGDFIVSSGASDFSDTLVSGGTATVISGALESGVSIGSSGVEIVSSGATVNEFLLSAGGSIVQRVGAVEIGGSVLSGADLLVANGAIDLQDTIASGGSQIVSGAATRNSSSRVVLRAARRTLGALLSPRPVPTSPKQFSRVAC